MRRVGLVLLCLAGAAWADQSRITHFTNEARKLSLKPGAEDIPAQLGTFRAWIAEAQAAQIAKKPRAVTRALARVEAQHALIVALLYKETAKQAAETAKSSAEEMRRAASEAHVEVARQQEIRRRLAASVDDTP